MPSLTARGEIGVPEGSLPELAEAMHLAGVELEPEKGVLVVRTRPTSVQPNHFNCPAARAMGMIHAGGHAKPGRRVANSKSITPKRPSD
jgi:hypothetical protein